MGVIRNGLTDAKQVATSWTSGMAYAGTDGGIAIGVVDPAAPFLAGLFEDNNPWPIDTGGTGGTTSVDILAWLTASSITTVKTLAGIQGEGQGKYGTYTLLPRRYYAAPLSGKQPSGGITGIAANDGVSWQDASSNIQKLVTLAAANVALAALPVDIWAAAGTYYKVDGSGANSTGTVIDISGGADYLSIYGGFTGTETAAIGSLPTGRDGWFNSYAMLALGNRYGTVKDAARKTTLDAVNVGTAVKVANAANFVLDGFTITGGAQSGIQINNAPDTTLFTNLELSGNAVTGAGGGIYVVNGAPRLDKLTITNNTSTNDWGAGICIDGSSTAQVTNILVSGNVATNDVGGGIAIAGANPRLENIIVTGSKSRNNGGGIYIHGTYSVIVNALVIGNTCVTYRTGSNGQNVDAYSLGGGGIYVGPAWNGTGAIIVNALVSGNRMTVSEPPASGQERVGGGGIKLSDTGILTLINSTVSGNYAFHPSDSSPRGGGIMVTLNPSNGPSTLKLYNSLVVGNTGQGVQDDDLTVISSTYTASNSLVGGRGKAAMDATGGANADGASYGALALGLLSALNNGFFVKFPALPTEANTGDTGYNAAAWDFRLSSPPPGVIDGGSAAHYTFAPSGLVPTDVAGASRVQGGAPDMGAYESGLVGVPIPTYTVTNAKPQGTSSYGYLTVSSATAQAGVEVTITATLTTGYAVGTITCRTAGGATVPVTTIDSTHGKFTMPAENVTVDATFTTSSVGGQVPGFGS